MKIPKYIDEALIKRRNAAAKLMDYCAIVDEFIEKNGIDVPYEDYLCGVEIYTHPYDCEESVRKCILEHKERK